MKYAKKDSKKDLSKLLVAPIIINAPVCPLLTLEAARCHQRSTSLNLAMFCGLHLGRYFSRLGASKSSSIDVTSSSNHETSAYLNDGSAFLMTQRGPDPTISTTKSDKSVITSPKKSRLYSIDDPRNNVEPVKVALLSHKIFHSVCNQ